MRPAARGLAAWQGMDIMKIKLAGLGLGALLAATVAAQAGDFSYGSGMKDRMEVPAPIPVPAPVPVPEGFSYYLRADLNWSFARDISFSETGAQYGSTLLLPYSGLSNGAVSVDDVFGGTIGTGAYFTPHIRGDLTLDFRAHQNVDASATYVDGANGVVADTLKINRVVGLANVYWDLLQRGSFTPYIGAGIGFTYNDVERNHLTTEDSGGGPVAVKFGSSKDKNVGLAAALMAGVSFAFNHKCAIDVSYRALFLDGGSVTTTLSTGETSKATFGDLWEHQVRVGLRFNIW
jgi:opacity protein-like surface antigen